MEIIKENLEKLIKSELAYVQMRINYESGENLMQVFNSRDVKNWKNKVEHHLDDSIMVTIWFNNEKTRNRKNLLRFKFSNAKNEFHKFKLADTGMIYVRFIKNDLGIPKQVDEINKLLWQIYKLNEVIEVEVLAPTAEEIAAKGMRK